MCKALLPLPGLPVTVGPVAQLRKLPTSFSFENDLKRIFERFSGSFYASPHLAGEHFVCHVGYSLVLLHSLPFSLAHHNDAILQSQYTCDKNLRLETR
jgi:hypothetical protein